MLTMKTQMTLLLFRGKGEAESNERNFNISEP